eukprot:TRINITY_DN15752_c0_g1::TRINITY_DN15752_c0_g1_i1::g.25587::m.25587 TRINITY_DN15752_c0_g1::TRINITY_DN15752_c0_g1_i1::g.25587  ORF type:complete len:246 (+),score=29.82 TRINITY_DN15752_c0_g1_i1:27-764(+)
MRRNSISSQYDDEYLIQGDGTDEDDYDDGDPSNDSSEEEDEDLLYKRVFSRSTYVPSPSNQMAMGGGYYATNNDRMFKTVFAPMHLEYSKNKRKGPYSKLETTPTPAKLAPLETVRLIRRGRAISFIALMDILVAMIFVFRKDKSLGAWNLCFAIGGMSGFWGAFRFIPVYFVPHMCTVLLNGGLRLVIMSYSTQKPEIYSSALLTLLQVCTFVYIYLFYKKLPRDPAEQAYMRRNKDAKPKVFT